MAARTIPALPRPALAKSLALAAALAACSIPMSMGPLAAQDKYWDLNGATPGAGGPSPTGTWDTTAANWTTAALGDTATTTWVAGDIAHFSAGTDATGAYTVTPSGNQTAAGLFVEEGVVTIGPTGAVVLGAGQHVTVSAGATLSTNSSARISAPTAGGTQFRLNGGTLQTTNTGAAGSFVDVDAVIVLSGGGTIDYQVPNVLNIIQTNVVISGSGPLNKTGAGVIAIASASTYSGATNITGGELRIRTTANRLPVTTAVTVTSPGILNLNGVSQQIGSLTGDGRVGLGSGTLTVGDATSTAFTGTIEDTANAGASGTTSVGGKVTKVGAGTLTLAGVNTYTGLTTVNGGTLAVASGGSIASSSGYAVTTGTLDVSASGGLTVGPGNKTLSGNGTVVGTVTVSGTSSTVRGTVAPGTSIGTLNVGSMVWQPNGNYAVEHDPNSSGTAGTTNDFISGTGTLDLTGLTGGPFTLTLVPLGSLPATPGPQTYTIATFAGGVTLPGGQDPANLNNLFTYAGAFNSAPVTVLNGNSLQVSFTPVPEPAFVLLGCGAVAGAIRWRKRRPTPAAV